MTEEQERMVEAENTIHRAQILLKIHFYKIKNVIKEKMKKKTIQYKKQVINYCFSKNIYTLNEGF